MAGSVITSVAATAEPVSVEEIKDHLRVLDHSEDDLISRYLKTAREYAESVTSRQFVTATKLWTLDEFPATGVLFVPCPPLISVTSIKYYDSNDDLQTWSSDEYDVDARHQPGRIMPGYSYSWPTVRPKMAAIEVAYQAGYGDPSDVPETFCEAIKLMTHHLWVSRSSHPAMTCNFNEMPLGVASLLGLHNMRDIL